jgi:3-deoxy-D-manno-octulosonate 8-phosphate phosphatase (KDO 8-P phosphatase)
MNLLDSFKKISCFAFDVDGVLTDGSLLVLDDGQMVRRMNIKDGYALQLAVKKGYKLLIISGGMSEAVRSRLNKLGIEDVFLKVENKSATLEQYRIQNKLELHEILFMGDDIPDYDVMKRVGIACCPADAAAEIKSISQYISIYKGGEGCARDVIEKVMKVRGDWNIDTSVPSK